MRDLQIEVASWDDSIREARAVLRRLDQGQFPDRPIERVCFHDFKTLLKYVTPKRRELLETLRCSGMISIRTLSRLLKRSYTNVFDDVRALEFAGLLERDARNHVSVPWIELESCLSLDPSLRGRITKPTRRARCKSRTGGNTCERKDRDHSG